MLQKSALREKKNILALDNGVVAQPYEYTENQWIVQYEMVDFMVCELYFSWKQRCPK